MASKIITVVGARPQFIKAAMVSRQLAKRDDVEEILVHTGQHFDRNMSELFFEELDIPEPKVNLGISGGTHAQMTARMMIALEEAMLREEPAAALLYGDTNSTLAAALAAAKLHVPVAHVEAGARTHSKTNPEEINRICTDHVSSLLLACTEGNLDNLKREGIGEGALFSGDPMLDAFLFYRDTAAAPSLKPLFEEGSFAVPEDFYYLTCHREENTGDGKSLEEILATMEDLDSPVVYPVHPRNRSQVASLVEKKAMGNVLFVEPVGYLDSVYLASRARQVVTDSGGLQREAFFAGVKCTTLLDFEVWPETMVGNRNLLARPERKSILSAMSQPQHIDPAYRPFGDGAAARRIADAVADYVRSV